VEELVGLLGSCGLHLEALDRAAFATLGSCYRELKAAAEEVEGAREELVARYSQELAEGGRALLAGSARRLGP
jgi:dynein heavy chain